MEQFKENESNIDITDTTYSNEQFEKLKWKFALENSSIGIWSWDNTNNQDRVFFSKESKAILGFTDNDDDFGTSSQDWNDRVHSEDKKKYFQDFQDHLNGLYPIYENIHRILCNDGSYRWISDTGKIIEKDKNGKAVRIIGTHTDITSRVENETKIKKSLETVTKQNNKLRNFAHIVTHNLKEHSGNFESLLSFYDEAETKEDKEELIGYLKTLSQSLGTTISNLNQIVTVESKQEISIEKININSYFKRAIKLLEVVIKDSNTTIINNIDDNLELFFSPPYMESIIQNLLTNAIKYKHPERDPIIEIKSTTYNENIVIKITDNGLGVNLNKFGKDIFGLYKTFHTNQNSEGVGLYLIKSQVESLGGTIDLASVVDVGTSFIITIPNKKNPI
jgi:PAS domain S-box-containing protein